MIKKVAENNIPEKTQKPKQDYITPSTLMMINMRKRKKNDLTYTNKQMKDLDNRIKQALKRDKKRHILNTVNRDLDVRDNWAGIRALRKEYSPMPYNRKNS